MPHVNWVTSLSLLQQISERLGQNPGSTQGMLPIFLFSHMYNGRLHMASRLGEGPMVSGTRGYG